MSIKFPLVTGAQAKEMREKLRMNQTEFWGAVFITQSGASRYESGRAIPKPAQILIVWRGKPRHSWWGRIAPTATLS